VWNPTSSMTIHVPRGKSRLEAKPVNLYPSPALYLGSDVARSTSSDRWNEKKSTAPGRSSPEIEEKEVTGSVSPERHHMAVECSFVGR
jgi:hypothetical protein